MKKTMSILLALCTAFSVNADYKNIPLTDDIHLEYQGAFRFSVNDVGASRMPFTNGVFAIAPNGTDFFASGHAQMQGIAEFTMPALEKSQSVKKLPFAKIKQPFVQYIKNPKKLKNSQNLDTISGMELIEGELFVNAVEYYDAPADNTHTTFIIRKPANLKQSKVNGFFKLQGRVNAAGWMSKIPDIVKSEFPGSYIVGNASNVPINTRLSIGPSAFASNIDALAGVEKKGGAIPTFEMMNFSVNSPLHPDQYNKSKKNDVWTEVSYAAYGFIEPNGKYYIIVGHSGGHNSSIGYKIKQNNGKKCGGPCSKDYKDNYNYYWIFDVKDLVKAKNGELLPTKIRPIKYGKLDMPFQPKNGILRKVIGADFDPEHNNLWFLLENVDHTQSKYEAAPVMAVYKLSNEKA